MLQCDHSPPHDGPVAKGNMATIATVTLEDLAMLGPCIRALLNMMDGQPFRLAATSCGEPVTVATPPLPPDASAQADILLPESVSVAALRASSHCTIPVGGAGAGGLGGLGGGEGCGHAPKRAQLAAKKVAM